MKLVRASWGSQEASLAQVPGLCQQKAPKKQHPLKNHSIYQNNLNLIETFLRLCRSYVKTEILTTAFSAVQYLFKLINKRK